MTVVAAHSGLRALFHSAPFLRLWAIGSCVNTMRWFEVLAAALFTMDVTGSGLAVAVVSAARTMPMFLFDDDPDLRKGYRFCAEMVSRGVYMHPFHNMFISNALTMDDVGQTLEAADGAFRALVAAGPELAPNTRLAALSA